MNCAMQQTPSSRPLPEIRRSWGGSGAGRCWACEGRRSRPGPRSARKARHPNGQQKGLGGRPSGLHGRQYPPPVVDLIGFPEGETRYQIPPSWATPAPEVRPDPVWV